MKLGIHRLNPPLILIDEVTGVDVIVSPTPTDSFRPPLSRGLGRKECRLAQRRFGTEQFARYQLTEKCASSSIEQANGTLSLSALDAAMGVAGGSRPGLKRQRAWDYICYPYR